MNTIHPSWIETMAASIHTALTTAGQTAAADHLYHLLEGAYLDFVNTGREQIPVATIRAVVLRVADTHPHAARTILEAALTDTVAA